MANLHFSSKDSVQSRHGSTQSPFVFNRRQNHLPRNTFDMSRHTLFHSPAGLLLPNFVQEVIPGDYIHIQPQNFTRTEPMNTAAFARIREVTDFFFVPYKLLWSGWDSFIAGVKDFTSSVLDPTKFSEVPSFPYGIFMRDTANKNNLSTVDDFGIPIYLTANRIFSLLGYPNTSVDGGVHWNDSIIDRKLNPFRLCAFNKIYSDFYRLSDWEDLNVKSFNLDDKNLCEFTKAGSNGNLHYTDNSTSFQLQWLMHYVPWAKDRFTGIKPSRNLGLGTLDSDSAAGAMFSTDNDTILNLAATQEVSAQDLRQLLSVDKLSRISMLSPKYFRTQVKDHYGVDVSKCDACSTRFLGSFDSQMQIGEVLGTAAGQTDNGSSSVLGQIGGRGVSVGNNNRPINFQADQFGIVMGIHYFLPISEYDSDGIDDFNQKVNRFDFFQPEFDNLGLQPVRAIQATANVDSQHLDEVLGYQARYMEYKTSIDKIHGQFRTNGALSEWTAPRHIDTADSGVSISPLLHVTPHITDSLFALKYDGSDKTDPFLCHFFFDVKMSRNMSVDGLPII